MNERIKELAEQAGIKHRFDIPNEIWGHDKDLEKFAELLIEECFYTCIDDGDIQGSIYQDRLNTYFGTKI